MHVTGFAPVNGAYLYYELMGEGHPLVLIHAGIADRRMWDMQYEVFARHFRVLRYDRRGYGKSEMVAGDYSHSHDLYELLHYLKIEQAHFIGCSYGGRTLIEFVLEHPQIVSSLAIVASSPAGYQFESEPPIQLEALEMALDEGDLERASELEVQIWVDGPLRSPDEVPASVRDLVREMNLIALQNETLNLGHDLAADHTVDRLSEITAPTLLLWGDLDRPRVCSAGEYMATRIPNAKKHILTGTAHLPNMERPDEFNRMTLDFLLENTRANL